MITIKKGEIPQPPSPWWVGEILTCPRCQHQVKLEEGDPVHETSVTINIPVCPTCGGIIVKSIPKDRIEPSR